MQISIEAKNKIANNYVLLGQLCSLFNKHMKTIERWIEKSDSRLQIPDAIKIFTKETGLTAEQIFTKETNATTA
jgi:hypothetical protein